MTVRRFILAGLCLCGGACCAAFSRLDAEDAVRRALAANGMHQGYDAETGVYMVIASAAKSGVAPGTATCCAQQAACFRSAELNAFHQILNMRGQSMAGRTAVQRDAAAKSVRSFVETLSQADLDGCLLVEFQGWQDGDTCVVAVAMSWSEDLERRARASAAGRLRPADAWIDELKGCLAECDGDVLPPTLSFVDSAGFFHRAGVGRAPFDGASALQRNAAVKEADLWARKNLQLALYGRAAMRKKAELMKAHDRLEGERSLSSAYEALGDVSADTPLPAGSRPLFDKVVQVGDGQMKSFVVVYGVDPPKTVRGISDSGSQTAERAPDGVLIWNPNTGKFEKQQ
jgi:hypothetical protein